MGADTVEMPGMPGMPETPGLIIDTAKMRANLQRMAAIARDNGVKLRPHTKTHKIPELAKLQLEYGASGITVAKIAEAEVMADAGIDDIFVAFPLIGESKLERAIRLAGRGVRLILGVDSPESGRLLSDAAARHGLRLEARLEVDTGLHRTGVPYEAAAELAEELHRLEGLQLTGIYTYRGSLYQGRSTLDRAAAGDEEGRMMAELAERIRAAGVPIADVSVGSTPTSAFAAGVPGVTEIRPGTYIFQDRMQAGFGVCALDDCAGTVAVTVVSRQSDHLMVVNGGSKTFATDVQPGKPPLHLEGFGHIVEAPDAVFEWMSEEHGMIRTLRHHPFRTGDIVTIIPNHICSTVNLHNHIYLLENGLLRKTAVAARGMLE